MTGARSTHTAPFFFAEYHSYPQDADCGCADSCRPFAQRADFVDTLDGAQAAHFSRELVLAGGRRLAAVTVFFVYSAK